LTAPLRLKKWRFKKEKFSDKIPAKNNHQENNKPGAATETLRERIIRLQAHVKSVSEEERKKRAEKEKAIWENDAATKRRLR
jgi:hypothetical protein